MATASSFPLSPSHLLQKPSTPQSYKQAKSAWLSIVAFGLLALTAAFAVAMLAVKHASGSSGAALELGYIAGPGGAKLWLLSHLLRTPDWGLPFLSLTLYMIGVLALMWPERVAIMGIAGVGRLIASIMAIAGLAFAILIIRAHQDTARLAQLGYYDILPWLIFFDMAAMVLVNMRISGLAARGGFHRLAKLTSALMVVQVLAILSLLAALNVFHDEGKLMWAGSGLHAFGGACITLISALLMLAIAWNLLKRRL